MAAFVRFERDVLDADPALVDGAMEQPARQRRLQVRGDAGAATGLAEDRHVAGIAAEGRDVALDPFQRSLLIHDAVVDGQMAFAINCRMREEAKRADPVVERHDHYAAAADELAAVIVVALATIHAAAVEPDHHRPLLCSG